ncbi:hypothetical protein HNP82_001841 [Catenibacillus scindens]|uniref:Pilus assembly protein n=1 Tax=Catenibacillus scindens TaxID=673271 RepID=A0A7W8M503_9FIRM|nr:hypothetical protein [Catenibacillus scindens]MBB5264713.1 hypothetical protein [Catenibacillus scindens]
MKKTGNENGAIMVEAAIYMPIVLCTVMALIYLALFNMQEYMMMYQVQRVAAVAAREEAYIGYDVFGMGADNEIDFPEGGLPSSGEVTEYYGAYHGRLSTLYREVADVLSAIGVAESDGGSYTSRFASDARRSTLIALGTVSAPEVEIDTGFFGTEITVTMTHSIPLPGVLAYLGYDADTTIRTVAYSYSMNPSAFVRNVDLATDLVDYIMEKLGYSDGYNEFLQKMDEVLSVIF